LKGPWEITFGPDRYLWVTERTGKLVTRINPANGGKTTAVTIPEVFQSYEQDGLLGLALHSQLLRDADNDYVYVAYTYDSDPGPQLIVCATDCSHTLTTEQMDRKPWSQMCSQMSL
jgi:glucose/arabinose dehydrogenase